jgi:DNA helicase HerA-like ATPase
MTDAIETNADAVQRVDVGAAPSTDIAGMPGGFKRNRSEGFVIECDGSRAIISAISGKSSGASEDYWAVGQLISIRVGMNRIVGLIYEIRAEDPDWDPNADHVVHIMVELTGEIRQDTAESSPYFSGGIKSYPHMGAVAHRIRHADLAAVYAASGQKSVNIGSLAQDASIPALIDVDKLLSRHFAVVGTTGVGKSTAVTLLLRKIVETRPDIRVLILDPHNEFSSAFPDHAITVEAETLELPFWMFRLEEFQEVIFRGRPAIPEELDALRDLIPLAKQRFKKGSTPERPGLRRDKEFTTFTADTPVPYRIVELLSLIEERIGLLDGKAERPHLRALKNRIDSVVNDPRFKFMFGAKTVEDNIDPIIRHIFRIPQNGRPICAFQLSGIPTEVVNSVASILCRLAFDLALWSDGTIQTLVVCEEAHRYIPSDREAGFVPTRQAIARIAKEGRKYGVFLGVITQRPGELDATILSQCNTIFAMRLGNERDKDIIRQAVSGAAKSTISFLSSIANREAIAFGEALATPMRMMFEVVPQSKLPGSHIYANQAKLAAGGTSVPLETVINRLRLTKEQEKDEETGFDMGSPAPAAAPSSSRFSNAGGQSSGAFGAPAAANPAAPAAPVRRVNDQPPIWTPGEDVRLGRRDADASFRPTTPFGAR